MVGQKKKKDHELQNRSRKSMIDEKNSSLAEIKTPAPMPNLSAKSSIISQLQQMKKIKTLKRGAKDQNDDLQHLSSKAASVLTSTTKKISFM